MTTTREQQYTEKQLAYTQLMNWFDERAKHCDEYLGELTLDELNKIIDDEREQIELVRH